MFKSFAASDSKLLTAKSSRSSQPSQQPQPPVTVQRAVKLMLAGAAASTVYLVFALVVSFSVKSALVRWNATQPKAKQLTASQINSFASSYIITTIIVGLIAIALWLWMARMNNLGRNWARITASVFFVLWTYYTWVSIGQTRGALTLILALVIVLVIWLIGLAALFLLWRPDSTAFFKGQAAQAATVKGEVVKGQPGKTTAGKATAGKSPAAKGKGAAAAKGKAGGR